MNWGFSLRDMSLLQLLGCITAPTADTPQSPRQPPRAPAPAPPLRPKSYPAAMFPRLIAAPREHAATPHRHSQSRLAQPAPPRTTGKAQSHAPGRATRSPASPAETARTAPPQSPPPSTPARCAATPARFFRPQSKLADRLPDSPPCLQDGISAARGPRRAVLLARWGAFLFVIPQRSGGIRSCLVCHSAAQRRNLLLPLPLRLLLGKPSLQAWPSPRRKGQGF